ncbi:hypothetical protein [Lutibacter sp.]|uniref:hypothetical protein n=1 Tax=Lutibacter sp. TaxID=1925666 RepID=UPI002736BC52|nr:hypothetical protein [Lutibacter sp.]MDP3311878.1 hypothetical protein [Lutibacter sp.]
MKDIYNERQNFIFNTNFYCLNSEGAIMLEMIMKQGQLLLFNFFLIIPKSKFESAKKAFLRLDEIAKEEIKDPFSN